MDDKKQDQNKRSVLKLSGSVDMSRIMAARQAKKPGISVEFRGKRTHSPTSSAPMSRGGGSFSSSKKTKADSSESSSTPQMNKREQEARRLALSGAASFFVQAEKGRVDLAKKNLGTVEVPPPKKPEAPAPAKKVQSETKTSFQTPNDTRKSFGDNSYMKDNRPLRSRQDYQKKGVGASTNRFRGKRPSPQPEGWTPPVMPGRATLKGQDVKKKIIAPPPIKYVVSVAGEMSVAEIARCVAIKSQKIISWLRDMGVKAGANTILDQETVMMVVEGMGHEAVASQISEKELLEERFGKNVEPNASRPPVLAIMGHVDHGKTTLVDALCKTRQVAGEAGGITQNVQGYKAHLHDDLTMTLIDTPGHEAFFCIRERGAAVVDMVLLIVAADDGPKPQTEESIKYLRAQKLPFIVVVTKVDKAHDKNKLINELMRFEVIPESMGGDAIFVEISAEKGTNMDALKEVIALKAAELDLGSNDKAWIEGVVLDSSISKGRGVVAQILLQNGTLKAGQYVVADQNGGRVRAMLDAQGKTVKEAKPSDVVTVTGLSEVPAAGSLVVGVHNAEHMKTIITARVQNSQAPEMKRQDSFEWEKEARKTELSVVVRADAQGSIEALGWVLNKMTCEEWSVRVIQSEVGDVTESSVDFAKTSGSVLVGFNVGCSRGVENLASKEGILLFSSKVVYDIETAIHAHLKSLCAPKYEEFLLGAGHVIQVFDINKMGRVAGCSVTEGRMCVGMQARVTRGGKVLCTEKIVSLRKEKDTMKEVNVGFNCGVFLESFEAFEVGDNIECLELRQKNI